MGKFYGFWVVLYITVALGRWGSVESELVLLVTLTRHGSRVSLSQHLVHFAKSGTSLSHVGCKVLEIRPGSGKSSMFAVRRLPVAVRRPLLYRMLPSCCTAGVLVLLSCCTRYPGVYSNRVCVGLCIHTCDSPKALDTSIAVYVPGTKRTYVGAPEHQYHEPLALRVPTSTCMEYLYSD